MVFTVLPKQIALLLWNGPVQSFFVPVIWDLNHNKIASLCATMQLYTLSHLPLNAYERKPNSA